MSNLQPTTYYQVTINGASYTGAAPNDGFINNRRLQYYVTDFVTPPSGMTLATCTALRRGNVRYRWIMDQFSRVANMYASDWVATGATATTQPTAFSFVVAVERGDDVLTTPDELNAGTSLVGAAAIKRCIARAMAMDFVKQVDVYDPTPSYTTGPYGSTNNIPRFGFCVIQTEIGALGSNLLTLEGTITVTATTQPSDTVYGSLGT